MIALNVAANMLGLGNAATPFGIKAMEELQKLNPTDDTATDPMVMLLAINTAGVQLVPAGTLVALMGVAAGEVLLPMLVVTAIALVIAIVSAKVLGRLPAFRRSNPELRVNVQCPGPMTNQFQAPMTKLRADPTRRRASSHRSTSIPMFVRTLV